MQIRKSGLEAEIFTLVSLVCYGNLLVLMFSFNSLLHV